MPIKSNLPEAANDQRMHALIVDPSLTELDYDDNDDGDQQLPVFQRDDKDEIGITGCRTTTAPKQPTPATTKRRASKKKSPKALSLRVDDDADGLDDADDVAAAASAEDEKLPKKRGPKKKRMTPARIVRLRQRRLKANERERGRMHGLNDALERLRQTVPCRSRTQKLSKIETLRLASNYIATLSDVLKTGVRPDAVVFARALSHGLTQNTVNLVAAALQINPRSLIVPVLPPDLSIVGRGFYYDGNFGGAGSFGGVGRYSGSFPAAAAAMMDIGRRRRPEALASSGSDRHSMTSFHRQSFCCTPPYMSPSPSSFDGFRSVPSTVVTGVASRTTDGYGTPTSFRFGEHLPPVSSPASSVMTCSDGGRSSGTGSPFASADVANAAAAVVAAGGIGASMVLRYHNEIITPSGSTTIRGESTTMRCESTGSGSGFDGSPVVPRFAAAAPTPIHIESTYRHQTAPLTHPSIVLSGSCQQQQQQQEQTLSSFDDSGVDALFDELDGFDAASGTADDGTGLVPMSFIRHHSTSDDWLL